ncbi:MAG: hypothetical protein ABJH28_19950 [Paraglaciecola sp.]|uniref:hypothetical protein n=1 Tax=Paraglaciecola sp. TaxID=1920173 RepID=UPI00329A5FE4
MKKKHLQLIYLITLFYQGFLYGTENTFSPIRLSTSINKVQPMTGIAFWASNNKALEALGDTVQLEFSYLTYSDVIETKGHYKWEVIDNLLNDIASRKHQAILRFHYTYPGKVKISVPAYIFNDEDYARTSATVENKKTFVPDWSFKELETFTTQFFANFAARYDGDPRLAMIQVGFGSYAEYHLYNGPRVLGKTFPTKKFHTSFFKTMNDKFDTTQWSVSIDAANSDYGPFSSKAEHANLNFGLFDDSMMHKTHSVTEDEYNLSSWKFFGIERYRKRMMGGEFSYYSDYDQKSVLTYPDGAWGRSFESFVDQFHLSYIIGNDQFRHQAPGRIREASMSMGYKFHVNSFEASNEQSRISISNIGVAPLYYDANPAVNGVRSNLSLKGLLPNQTIEFLIDSGGDTPSFAIESDYLVEGQVIGFSAD